MNFATGYAEKKTFDFGNKGAWVEIKRPNMKQAFELQAIAQDESMSDEEKNVKTKEVYCGFVTGWNLNQKGKEIKCNKKNKMLMMGTEPFFKFMITKIGSLSEWETQEQLDFDLVSKN